MVDEKEMIIKDKFITSRNWKRDDDTKYVFSNHYKQLRKVLEQNISTDTPNSDLTNMLLT